MKRLASITVAFALMASAAFAEDECMLELSTLTSKLAANAPGVKVISPAKIDASEEKRGIEETIRLASGDEVTYSEGGCVHFDYTLSMRKLKEMPTSKGKPLFDFLQEKIASVPLKKDGNINRQTFLDDIAKLRQASTQKKHWLDDHTLITPGDATLTLTLFSDGFDLNYDFPM